MREKERPTMEVESRNQTQIDTTPTTILTRCKMQKKEKRCDEERKGGGIVMSEIN